MEIVERVSFKDIRESGAEKIYYAARTCWWTHDLNHLSLTPPLSDRARAKLSHRLPCDPRGSVLFETDNVQGFLDAAENNATHYGRHGLRAFMAAHHSNCQRALDDPRPWSGETWDEYNDALDRLDEREGKSS